MVAVRTPTVALVGNPNTGKTTLFNALAGMNQRVGNYPGVTVETKKGKLRHHGRPIDLIDLPGTYSLAPRSPDEMVAVEVILGRAPGEPRPDAVVAIVDASNLERNLYLMTQVLELGVPVVLALNMVDVARGQGLEIDVECLAKNLDIPVVPIQANRGVGLEALKEAIGAALDRPHVAVPPAFPEAFEREAARLAEAADGEPPYLVRRALLDVGGQSERLLTARHGAAFAEALRAARQRLIEAGCPVPVVEARTRYAWIRAAVAPALRRPTTRPVTWTDRLDRVFTHRIWGTLIFLVLMFAVFQAIYFGGNPIKDLLGLAKEALGELVTGALAAGPLRSLIVEGVINGVGGVLEFLPQIVILFAAIAVLEDCGYMARAAFLMDRLMARAGLNGKSFIPLLSSLACAVPGILGARVIEDRRDRLATILVAPLMSCAARLPVYALLIGAFLEPPPEATWLDLSWWVPGLTLFGLYLLGLVLAPLVAFALKRTLLRGETPVFVMEMPLYKAPSVRTVARRAYDAGVLFVRRAGTLILASMIVVWALLYFPSTDAEGNRYDLRREALRAEVEEAKKAGRETDALEQNLRTLEQQWRANSILGRLGRALEPVVRPLGWDWRVGMAALASFPAREVMVGTLGIIFGQGEGEADDAEFVGGLAERLRTETWEGPSGRRLFTVPVALSVMVFFALCCQCASTLAVIKRETNSWRWPAFTFVYMTALAYVGALVTYQVGTLLGG